MNVPPLLQRHRALRWAVPAGVVAVAGLVVSGVFSSSPTTSKHLPATTPAALVAAVRSEPVGGFTGTVLSRISIGLPQLPAFGSSSGASLGTLLTGSHTLQVWYGGAKRQRVALLGATDETDVFRAGRSFWEWNSATRVAQHARLPRSANPRTTPALPGGDASGTATPAGLARDALAALDPSTRISVRRNAVVADRAAYDLILTPRSGSTTVGSVHIAIDGATKIPLEVRIYPRGSSDAAVDVGFTSINIGEPAKTNFHFSPPSGSGVRRLSDTLDEPMRTLTGNRRPKVIGSGWTRVLDLHADRRLGGPVLGRAGLSRVLTTVSGSWGHGHLLRTRLLNVLFTRDGHILSGTVAPSLLYAAAAAR